MSSKPTYEELEQRIKGLGKLEAEHLRADEALKAEKEFATSLIDNAPTFFVAIDAQGKTTMMNQHMLTELGYKADEVVGKDYLSKFIPERERDTLASVFKRLTAEHKPTFNENHILSKNGQEFLVEWHGIPVFDINREFQYFYGIGINITERKKMEEALRESEERYRYLSTGTFEAIVLHDKGKIIEANEQYYELFGYNPEELAGKDA
ncbi:unnamed protein product, partial [marine sediment metagenome]